jgi:hypothetical protein
MRPTPLEMNLFIDEHPQIRTSAEIASKMASFCCRPSVIGLCHWLFADLDSEGAA